VVLFDEIEKAHPDVFNILLQILEEGELTDNNGSAVSFRDTIIIMTSNIGSRELAAAARMGFADVGDTSSYDKDTHFKELKRLFSPEFINRLDEVIYFHKLERKHITKIVDLMLDDVNERLGEKGIELIFSGGARRYLAEHGFDEKFGARFLRRTIQTEVEDPLATEMLKGKFENASKISVGVKSGRFYFRAVRDEESGSSGGNAREEPAGLST
jgi:ATP-dependent Clp protease ATP-binding subunit ClpC